ncbi:aminotransferase-like domain-containing protein [Niallia nealsonii]|uniref:GntR family transcriptional regulator n=1 Tax=Niallia nealsonii TaxID=115979 RepID=A0A2N0Z0H6_9BACI|nr:PLP-dependent aminotransferase family protein [Niallia nealsonii]PKG23017.1 GntR family transcriptional regulator [Niallia nealsonii]
MTRIPLYQQVCDYIIQRIKTGEWEEGSRLPSIRTLASQLGVNRLTVLKAFQVLKDSQYVYAKDKSGYYVQKNADNQKKQQSTLNEPKIYSYIKNSHLSDIHNKPVNYMFSTSLIDPKLLPNRYLSEHVKEVFDQYPQLLGTYAPVKGDKELIKGFSAYFQKYYNFYIHEESILITTGAQQGIDIIAKVFVQSRDYVLIDSPTYSAAVDIFLNRGAQLLPIDLTTKGFSLEQVESYMKKYKPKLFYMNPTFHNPTGYTVPTEQRKQLVELAERYQCILVEDDSFHEIYFVKAPPAPIFTYDPCGYVIYLRSFSKYIAPGLRICALLAHPILIKWLVKGKALADNGTPLLNQKAFLYYLTSERVQRHMEKLRIALQLRKEAMEKELSLKQFQWNSPAGGLNLWVKLHEDINIEKFKIKALEQQISIVPGNICDPLARSIPYIRLSYSFLNEQEIKEGIQLLNEVHESLKV